MDTVKELRNRRADNLAAKMAEINQQKKLTRKAPSEKQVAKWVEQAKSMEADDYALISLLAGIRKGAGVLRLAPFLFGLRR